jgi:hypothetical protein
MYQFSTTLQQYGSDEGVAIGAGVGEGGVPGAGLGVNLGTSLQQELDDVDMALLGGLHQRSGCTQLNISSCMKKRLQLSSTGSIHNNRLNLYMYFLKSQTLLFK